MHGGLRGALESVILGLPGDRAADPGSTLRNESQMPGKAALNVRQGQRARLGYQQRGREGQEAHWGWE